MTSGTAFAAVNRPRAGTFDPSGGRRERGALRLVLGRRATDHRAEVADEVRVVEVAEVEREPGPVAALARGELLGRLLEAVTAQHPLRPDADMATEEPLQRARGDGVPAGDVRDGRARIDLEHVGDDRL